MNALPNALIINKTYTVEARLGAGAFGDVYLVHHRFLGQQALKVFQNQDQADLETLLIEARMLVDLTHPNIVRIYDTNICEETSQPFVFMTMEFANAGTLAQLISRKIELSESSVLSIGLQVASALAHCHSRAPALLHRDIKPTNILVFEDGAQPLVKVSDYGAAGTVDPVTRLTHSAGTIAFAPPEMAWGVTDERADVYGLGVTLYRALTGIHPFPLVSPTELSASRKFAHALSHGRKDIPAPSRLLMRAPRPIDLVIMKCLEFDMFSRYRNGQELHTALENLKD